MRLLWNASKRGVENLDNPGPTGNMSELVEALQMSPGDFKEQYKQKMPAKSDRMVFSCLAGVRSKQALDFARSLGFSRVQHYAGGFEEWAKREPPEKK